MANAPKLYFLHEKTGQKYLVVHLDKTTGEVTLRGEGAEFTEQYDKARFQRMGYKLIRGDNEDAEQQKLSA